MYYVVVVDALVWLVCKSIANGDALCVYRQHTVRGVMIISIRFGIFQNAFGSLEFFGSEKLG